MANLPQYYEWVKERKREPIQGAPQARKSISGGTDKVLPPPLPDDRPYTAPLPGTPRRKLVKLKTLLDQSIEQWRSMVPSVKTDDLLGDASINNVIFTKVKEGARRQAIDCRRPWPRSRRSAPPPVAAAVFAALLDAATLAGSWIVVDRTCGNGSATAELLLEMALDRGGTTRSHAWPHTPPHTPPLGASRPVEH